MVSACSLFMASDYIERSRSFKREDRAIRNSPWEKPKPKRYTLFWVLGGVFVVGLIALLMFSEPEALREQEGWAKIAAAAGCLPGPARR